MDSFSELVLSRVISQGPRNEPTSFVNLNDALGGGLPKGRLIEIYGRSQIGKSILAINLFPNEIVCYFDLSRKLCTDYLGDNTFLVPPKDDHQIFPLLNELVRAGSIVVIDDLTMLGRIDNDAERFKWLTRNFMTLQRNLAETEGMVIVLNQIRMSPGTGKAYNPHEGCLDAAVKIKMHFAEKKGDSDLVYLDIEKHFWGKQGARCTLLVSKNNITVPSFYVQETIEESESL